MNRDFLSNFERPNQDKGDEQTTSDNSEELREAEYGDGDYIRNVCFVWPDGRRKFLNYGRLDSGEINEEQDTINLFFRPENVELVGLRLLPLFEAFIDHKPKFVYCDDARYNELSTDETIINEIIITERE
jgi:hypothetical protein